MRGLSDLADLGPNHAAPLAGLLAAAVLLTGWPILGCDSWQLVNPRPVAEDLSDVVWAGDRYVAVGAGGTILERDGTSGWVRVPSGVDRDLYGVTWSGDWAVAVGAGGMVLTRGEVWEPRPTGLAADLLAVAAGPDGLVAVGEGGTVLTSRNGAAWSTATSGTDVTLRDVTWADTAWVAVGDGVTVVSSPDGVGWTAAELGFGGDLSSVAAHGQRVVAVGSVGACLGTVAGGVVTMTGCGYFDMWCPTVVEWCGDRFVAAGCMGDHHWSYDGVDWEEDVNPREQTWLDGLGCGPDGLVGVGPGGTAVSSPDGARWRLESGVTELDLADVAWNGRGLVALGGGWRELDAPPDTVLVSSDGAAWQVASRQADARLVAVVGQGERFLAAGTCGYGGWYSPHACVGTSTDGLAWELAALGGMRATGVAWDGRRFLVVGGDTLWISPDGGTWSRSELPENEFMTGVASDGAQVVLVGHRGGLLTSPDGASWTQVDIGVDVDLHAVTWGAGGYVAVGDQGVALWSGDGLAWSRSDSSTGVDLYDTVATADGYLAAGGEGLVLTSPDGRSWQAQRTAATGSLYGLVSTDSGVVAVGSHGLVERTTCRPDPAPVQAGLTWQPAPVEAATVTRFLDLSLGAPTSWAWSFGDGGASQLQNPDHTFSEGGTYTVSLSAANASGESTAAALVTVLSPCRVQPAPHLEGPAQAPSGESFTVTWTPVEGGHYEVERSADPVFLERVSRSVTRSPVGGATSRWSEERRVFVRVREVQECADGDIPGEWSNVLAVTIVPTVRSAGSFNLLVPAAAHRGGVGGRLWRSDLALHNPGQEPATVLVFLLDGQEPVGRYLELDLPPNESRGVEDVVARLVPGAEAAGGLLVSSDRRVQALSRVVTDGPVGEVGEVLPAVPPRFSAQPEALQLLMLGRDDRGWTNLDLVNGHFNRGRAEVYVRAADQTMFHHLTVDLPPLGHVQLHDFLAGLENAGRVEVTVEPQWGGRGQVHACASTVDPLSGEPAVRLAATEADEWSLVAMPPPTSGRDAGWAALAYADGRYVAGGAGLIGSSTDGHTWTVQEFEDGWVEAAGWNGREWVAVGAGVVARSTDAVTWDASSWPPDAPLNALAWGGSLWVAVGANGTVARSGDGREWERPPRLEQHMLTDVVWCGNQFVAVGDCVAVSPDGVRWRVSSAPGWYSGTSLACGGSRLVAVSHSGAWWSDNGVDWAEAEGQTRLSAVGWTGERFVALGFLDPRVVTSTEGLRWDAERTSSRLGRDSSGPPERLIWDGEMLVSARFTWLLHHGPEVLVPGARSGLDPGGRRWRTDLDLVNLGPLNRTCTLELLVPGAVGEPPRRMVTVNGRRAVRLEDALGLFGHQGRAALRVAPDAAGVEAASRTWADSDHGSVGMAVPGLTGQRAVTDLDQGRLIGLSRGADPVAGTTTDIGLASVCRSLMAVSVGLFRGNGEPLGTFQLELAPGQVLEVEDPFGEVGSGEVEDGFAVVETATPRCAVHAWAVVSAAGSGDPVFIPVERIVR